MSENKITFPVKLASNNPQSFGIVDATEISGHRSVDTISDLYSISDPVLSVLKDGSDAIGQEWFVVSEDCKYRLDNWENRKSVTGWTKLPKQELIDSKQSVSEKDKPSGYAGLDSNGKIPIEKTYGTTATVVDVATYEKLPVAGLSGVIYYVSNTGAQYKWSGSAYIDITDGADNAKKNETSIFDCSNGTSTKYYSSLSAAINVVPPAYRTSNRIISYLSTENSTTSAVNYQYHGIDSTTWTDLTKWERVPNQSDLAEIRSDLSGTTDKLTELEEEVNEVTGNYQSISAIVEAYRGTYFASVKLEANKIYRIKLISCDIEGFILWAFESTNVNEKAIITELNKWYEFTPINDGVLYIGDAAKKNTTFTAIVGLKGKLETLSEDAQEIQLNVAALSTYTCNLNDQINSKTYKKNNELIAIGGGNNYEDIILEQGKTYTVSISESNLDLQYNTIYMFCNADTLSDGVMLTSLSTEYTFSPKNTGILRVASGASADIIITFNVKDNASLVSDVESKVSYNDIVDNVNSDDPKKPLSAKQGKMLNDVIVGELYDSDEITVTKYGGTNLTYTLLAGKKYRIRVTSIDVPTFNIWAFSLSDPNSNRVTITETNKDYELIPQNNGVIRLGDGNGSGPYKFTISISTGSLKNDIQAIDEQLEIQQNRVAKLESPNIIIKKINNTAFNVHVKSASNDKYLIHEFKYDTYTKDMSSYGGSASQICGDLWDVGGIMNEEGNYILAGNLNMIYMLDSSVNGFEHENLHVGMGGGQSGAHGLEVREFTKFFADGVEFEPSSMHDEIRCSTFRMLQKSKCYAADSSISAVNSNNYPKLQNGQPIVTAEHFIDAECSVDNEIRWRNRLIIRRDHVKFSQCHGAMVAIKLGYFKNIIINDDKTSQNTYENIEGAFVETPIGDSNPLNKQEYRADEVVCFGNGYVIHQRMCQDDGSRYNKSFIQSNNNNNQTEMKCYMMPVVCGSNGSGEEFNSGDEISVTNIRKIEYE